jgi:hypothetical protein
MNRPDRFRRSTVEYFDSSNEAFSVSGQLSWWLGAVRLLAVSAVVDVKMKCGREPLRCGAATLYLRSVILHLPDRRSPFQISAFCWQLRSPWRGTSSPEPGAMAAGLPRGRRRHRGAGRLPRWNSKTSSQRACDAVASSFQSAARVGRAFRPAHAAAPAFPVAAVRVGADRLAGRDRLRGSLSRAAAPRSCRSMLQSGWLAPIPAR